MSAKPTAVADGDQQILGAAVRVGDAVDLAGTLQGIVAAAREALGADRASCYVVSQGGVIEAGCTSLDMAGCSVTLVKLDDELTALLEAPAEIPIRTF